MTNEQLLSALQPPARVVDVVLDTDTYNEIDDQFALSYLLRSPERARVRGIFAAPFFNENSVSPEDGMEKSHREILKLLALAGREELVPLVCRGSRRYLPNEDTPVPSEAADRLLELSRSHTADRPLYVVAIGAITNVASALLTDPGLKDRICLIWLGGHAHRWPHTAEFNMMQDVAAARVVFGCGVPLVQIPCCGVADRFSTTQWELEHWLRGKNALCDYLIDHTVEAAERYAAGQPWSRVIWDVTAVGWLIGGDRFTCSRLCRSPIPEYDHHYGFDDRRHPIRCVTEVYRDALIRDLFEKLGGQP